MFSPYSAYNWYKERKKHLATLQMCERCNTYYSKDANVCPYCENISKEELEAYIKNRNNNKNKIGKTMYYLATIMIIILLGSNFL